MCVLPHIVDYWFDNKQQARASIQVQMISLSDEMLHCVTYCISSLQNEFVVTLPVSLYIHLPKDLFHRYVLQGISEEEKKQHGKILDFHAKKCTKVVPPPK